MQNIRISIFALPAALALSACATTRDAPLPDGGDVALGQKAYVDGPLDARCVWAGRVRLKMVWIRGNGERQPFEATLGEPTQLADGQFTLESVRPEKRTDVAIKPGDYRFSFRFAGGL